jgi:hypothetical protein
MAFLIICLLPAHGNGLCAYTLPRKAPVAGVFTISWLQGEFGTGAVRNVQPIDFLDTAFDAAYSHSLGAHRQDFLLHVSRQSGLLLFNQFRLERALQGLLFYCPHNTDCVGISSLITRK